MAKVIYGDMPISQMKLFASTNSYKWKTPVVLDCELGNSLTWEVIKQIDFSNKDLVFLTNIPGIIKAVWDAVKIQYDDQPTPEKKFKEIISVMLSDGTVQSMISFPELDPYKVITWAMDKAGRK